MKLRELDGKFVRLVTEDGHTFYETVDRLEDAQGIMFLCPLCFERNSGSIGTHSVLCWFMNRGVPDSEDPKPGRWTPSGSGLDDLTFVGPAAASVLLTSGCNWHGFVRNGDAS